MTAYTIQALQTNNTDSTLLLGRTAEPLVFWPRLSVGSNLPTAKQSYRVSHLVFTQPQKVAVDGVDTVGQNAIMDITFKLPKNMTDAGINSFIVEALKVANHADLVAIYKSQARLAGAVTTA